jgi:uncharacterized protein (TIGR02996 family)
MRNAEIEAAILAAPDDPSAYLVYADWLQARGDPHGELIALQHAMRAHNDIEEFVRLGKHESVLREKHAAAWLGVSLAAVPHRTQFQWRLGFIDAARLDVLPNQIRGELASPDPASPYAITRAQEPSLAALVTTLAESTCGWLVRTLTLSAPVADLAEAITRLPTKNLRKLVLLRPVWVDQDDAKLELSPGIMAMLNANVDVDVGGTPSSVEKLTWVRPTPSKRRT